MGLPLADTFATPADVMRRAIELARNGEGAVEPNPQVGAVVVDDRLQLLGEGWHERFGGPHAEIHALARAGELARGATLYVTLEPCCHFGKTPPCVDSVLHAGVRRVVVAMQDPFPQVAGGGIARLRQAGVEVEVGLLESEVRALTAPFRKPIETGFPWVHAKWAMSLDGKIATRAGHSQWISNATSRAVAHRLRGRMDAIVVGIGTALADDPLLTARPAGPRVATRVVVDSEARLPLQSQLVRTARQSPVFVATGPSAPADRVSALRDQGLQILRLPAAESPTISQQVVSPPSAAKVSRPSLPHLLRELGACRFTNILVEGGSQLLGSFFDQNLIDEVHVFIAPKLIGGEVARTALGGTGLVHTPELPSIETVSIEVLEGDVYVRGVTRGAP